MPGTWTPSVFFSGRSWERVVVEEGLIAASRSDSVANGWLHWMVSPRMALRLA